MGVNCRICLIATRSTMASGSSPPSVAANLDMATPPERMLAIKFSAAREPCRLRSQDRSVRLRLAANEHDVAIDCMDESGDVVRPVLPDPALALRRR